MHIKSKRGSIYTQLLRLLLVSAAIAAVFFLLMSEAGEILVDTYLEKTNYIEKEDQKYADAMQKFIQKEQLSSKNVTRIGTWVKKQKILSVVIYKDDIQIFDSEYPEQEIWKEEIPARNYDWETYYPIKFTDGEAEAVIAGTYDYQMYNYSMLLSLCISFSLFLIIVLMGIRKKMKYILKLNDEIQILEGGSLDYPITVQGKDELALLAEGLDNMRISFQNLIRSESEMVQENQRIVTEMSHDLRTPITAIMLYTEIIKKDHGENKNQTEICVGKIEQKAYQLKQLADHLFEYVLIAREGEVELEEPELYEVLFYDLFSEMCNYLSQKGFQVNFHVNWIRVNIRISTNYVMRIMDNLSSNIIKYADASEPIRIFSMEKEKMAGFAFENKVRTDKEETESTGIGLQSIKNMMQKMKGECIVEQNDQNFRIVLLFPYVGKEG